MVSCESEDGQAFQVVSRWRHHLSLLSMVRINTQQRALPWIEQLRPALPAAYDPFPVCNLLHPPVAATSRCMTSWCRRSSKAVTAAPSSSATCQPSTSHQPPRPMRTQRHPTSQGTPDPLAVCACRLLSINVTMGPSENRILMTGLHTVCDIYCLTCCDAIGWYYMEAFEESEKYKEKKFIVEKAKITKETIT